MIEIDGNWSGKITGTNSAQVYVELKQTIDKLSGLVRVNDPIYGTAVYTFKGVLNDKLIFMELTPDRNSIEKGKVLSMVSHGNVTLEARLVDDFSLVGAWRSTIGTGGELFLTNDKKKQFVQVFNDSENIKRNIFISYCHKDQKYLTRLHVNLKPLERKDIVDIWDDTKIKAGQKWKEQIEVALNKSVIAILIISADFLASDFIMDNELPPLLKKAETEGTKILPIILNPCRFLREENLSQFQSLNSPDQPLSSMSEHEQERLWDQLSQLVEDELAAQQVAR